MPPNHHDHQDDNHYALPKKNDKVVQPPRSADDIDENDATAINLIRQKLTEIYDGEPDAKKELAEEAAHHGRRSKHQEFMHRLSTSGKSFAEIQTAWHNYYVELPDHEKHEVWQEFYSNYNRTSTAKKAPQQAPRPQHHSPAPAMKAAANTPMPWDNRSPQTIQREIRSHVRSRAKSNSQQRFASLKFGLLTGSIVLVVMLFGFFNERFIAPFITPSRQLSSTPLIIDQGGAVGPEPKLIIPKINVEAPVVYDEPSIEEDAVQRALEDGVLHYATTPEPGELGNAVIFGHSSNNILNSGDYKFVFVLLNRLEPGDTFFVHKDGTRYTYRVFEKKVVSPNEVSVLGNTGKKASMTLITCDPPGTAINRLVVVGEQISPSPDTNRESSVDQSHSPNPDILPSNAPSLWDRLTSWL